MNKEIFELMVKEMNEWIDYWINGNISEWTQILKNGYIVEWLDILINHRID